MISFLIATLRCHARSHLGALLGVYVATAVLVGALAIGDCVRGSLTEIAMARLGKTEFAVAPGDRFFRAALADDLRDGVSNGLTAAVLELPGIAATPDGSARANNVQILGVDSNFWRLASQAAAFSLQDSVLLGDTLARQLHVAPGDAILLRAPKPSLLSSEAPLSPREDVASAFRLTVGGVVSDKQLGRFGLQAGAAPPLNAFVPIGFLQGQTELSNKANLLLAGPVAPGVDLTNAIRQRWQLADAGLSLLDVSNNAVELRSDRVFLDPEVVAAAATSNSEPILTYFVNELRDGSRAAPYSMVAAAGPPWTSPDLRDDEIEISQWLADDLSAKPGDNLSLRYFVLSASHNLTEETRGFRIGAVVPMQPPWADRTLMPDFPGISKAEKTENWDAGFRIDMAKIRAKDEQYWKEFRGTPKAFVTLAAGQQMWSNRFGGLTAIRFPRAGKSVRGDLETAGRDVLSGLSPSTFGLTPRPVRALALAASSQAEDLGQYFLTFSFFIIAAALILLAMLFQFGLEQRAGEIGVLLALGWRPRHVRRLLLFEGLAISILGSLLGIPAGLLYTKAILYGLAHYWGAAVNHTELAFHVTAQTIATGASSGVIVSVVVIWFALRSQTKRPARELLDRGNELEAPPKSRRYVLWVSVVAAISGLSWLGSAVAHAHSADAEAFFGSATLLLIAGISAIAAYFRRLDSRITHHASPLTFSSLSLRNALRRRKRSLSTIALLACGCFLIVAVAANKLDATQNSFARDSGTGGFAFIGESALPIVQDLNTPAGREFFNLDSEALSKVSFVPFRVHEGDDASCLNLNHAQTPRLLGVDPKSLFERHAFAFAEAPPDGWLSLTNSGEAVPGIADDASIKYSLHKSIGDTLDYVDERGRPFKVRLVGSLANSVLQGNVMIADAAFLRAYPGDSGARVFLVDSPSNSMPAVSAALTRGLQDRGMQLTETAARLNAYNAVQNAYLDTFQALGALGLLLGSAGVGVVVLRNVLERRAELATLAATGFRRRALGGLILGEHAFLEFLGVSLGIGAALLAVLPALLSPRGQIAYVPLGAALAAVLGVGFLSTYVATRLALRGPLLDALRNE